jgi:hypothetical protein
LNKDNPEFVSALEAVYNKIIFRKGKINGSNDRHVLNIKIDNPDVCSMEVRVHLFTFKLVAGLWIHNFDRGSVLNRCNDAFWI